MPGELQRAFAATARTRRPGRLGRKWRALLCRTFGHNPRSYKTGTYLTRRGHWRDSWRTECTRCGVDGPEAYGDGWLDKLRWWPRGRWAAFKHWRREDCTACGQPLRRYGRPVGDHTACDDIPF